MFVEGPRRRTRVTVPCMVGWENVNKKTIMKMLEGFPPILFRRDCCTYIPGDGVGLVDWYHLIESGLVDSITTRVCAHRSGIGSSKASKRSRYERGNGETHLDVGYKGS